jgi:phage-related protein
MTRKDVIWVGSSYADLRALPDTARQRLSRDLHKLQLGSLPVSWRPMNSIGPGVSEIRVRAEGAFRLIYVAKFVEGIYVLHVFQKKSRKTSPLDLELARARFKAALRQRQ